MTYQRESLVVVGRIRRSHGVKGVVVVEPLTADPHLVFIAGRDVIAGTVKGEATAPERRLHIEMAEPFQGGYRVQFDAIADRDEADRWRNRCVLSSRAELPAPSNDAVYLHDLIGMRVDGKMGEEIGRVDAYYELPHDVMIEIARPGAESVMVPYRFVIEVDPDRKRLVVEPPEGLL